MSQINNDVEQSVAETPCSKRSAAQRFLRSYFGRICVALLLIVLIVSSLWRQVIAEYKNEQRIALRVQAAGGIADFGGIPASFYTFYPLRIYARVVAVNLSDCEIPEGLVTDLKTLSRIERLHIRNAPITDADLINLQSLKRLSSLQLANTKITDAGVENLRGMSISRLSLQGRELTDAGLEHLKELPNLTHLMIVNTKISDAGLEHLKTMPNLKSIRMLATKTTPIGRAELQKSLPNSTSDFR